MAALRRRARPGFRPVNMLGEYDRLGLYQWYWFFCAGLTIMLYREVLGSGGVWD